MYDSQSLGRICNLQSELTNSFGCQATTTGNCNRCSSCCEADQIETAKQLLESSFFVAIKEVRIEKIKKIIERDWGDTINKTDGLAVKTIEKKWQASVSTSNTKKELMKNMGGL